MASERGLVVSCPITISKYGSHLKTTWLEPQELRFSLLFWDKLDFPQNNAFRIVSGANEEFLQKAGVLSRTDVEISASHSSDQLGQIVASAHTAAFRLLDEKQPGVWSIATGENSLSFPDRELEQDRGVLVSLYRCIPVPDQEVPLQDILEFRTKRHDELVALRHHLESVYNRIVSSGDRELAINTELEQLQSAIADQIRVTRETGFKLRLVDFSANLNLVPSAVAVLGALSLGASLSTAVGAGFAAAAISSKLGPSLSWQKKNTNTPIRYLSSFHKDLFRPT